MSDLRGPHRAIPWTALIGALVLLMAGVAMALYEEQLYQTQRLREAREEAEILAATEAAPVSFRDRSAAEEYVVSVKVNPEVEAVGVYASDGALLAGFVRDGMAPLPKSLGSPRPPKLENDRVFVTVPIVQQSTALGTVYLRARAEPMVNRLLREAVLALLVIMAVIVIAGLGSAQIRLERQAARLAEANGRLQTEMEERAKAEAALRQSQKMEAIGQLSGAIAHDFNNLLMIVKGNLHLLQRKLSLPDDDRHIRAAMEGVRRAASLTQRILAFSRKQDLSPTEVQLSDLIVSMDDLIRNSLKEDIEVVRDLRARSWVVLDPNQMENVVLNLVINARDAMPQGGKLFVSTEDVVITDSEDPETAPGEYVKLIIRDTGIGMSEDVRTKALDPFFTTKPSGQGTGLGLSTTFGFISQSGGSMQIESAPGKGTAIIILLPRVAVAESAKSRERA
ncbi:MAG TPA: ATP-binding protein [Rhizomicrobium sp.]|nr:ATP-binding protein [Rhizomicrobium sp.]